MSEAKLPAPSADDPEDVVLALHTASALWSRGDAHEAIRWVRRAATSAGENGLDLRAAALASAAADLTTTLGVPASVPSAALPGPGFAPASGVPVSNRAVSRVPDSGGLMDADDVDRTVVDLAPILLGEPVPSAGIACRAFRVAVRKGSDDRVLSVRLLAENEGPERGASEALLVTLSSDGGPQRSR